MSAPAFPIDDHKAPPVPHRRVVMEGAPRGPLKGLRFAVKDVFDIAGFPTGAGSPAWLASHPVPQKNNPLIEQLLTAGATLVGKTLTDESVFSLQVDHFDSAAAATGACDFLLDTDTSGSTRVAASLGGLWGLRTTHGLLAREALVPVTQDFDTVTWLAKDADVFSRVADVLLPAAGDPNRFQGAMLFDDALAQADRLLHDKVQLVFDAIATQIPASHCNAAEDGDLEAWRQIYATVAAHAGWQMHGAWIEAHKPVFAPPIARQWETARTIDEQEAAEAHAHCERIRRRLRDIIGSDGVAILPSAAGAMPGPDARSAALEDLALRTARLCCIAGLAGLPQVSIPFIAPNGSSIGVSLIGPAGSDRALIALAVNIWKALRSVSRH